MKSTFIALSLLISSLAFGEDISCTAKSFIGEDLYDLNVTTKEGFYNVGNFFGGSILETKSVAIDGPAVKVCLDSFNPKKKQRVFKCVEKITKAKKKNDSIRSLNNMLIHIGLARKSTVDTRAFMELPTEEVFSLEKVASGKIEVFSYGGQYPNHGIYDYFDSEGKLLARFYYRYLPSLCK